MPKWSKAMPTRRSSDLTRPRPKRAEPGAQSQFGKAPAFAPGLFRSGVRTPNRKGRHPKMPASDVRREAFRLVLVVHVELDRVRMEFVAHVFFHLQLDIGIDLVVVEHAAFLEEGAVGVEAGESFTQ